MDNCAQIKFNDWDYKWLNHEKVPFAFSNWNDMPLRWVGFDDVRSMEAKVRYLMRAGFGGAMVFSIDQEDVFNDCTQGEYPLLRVINFYLNEKTTNRIEFPDANKLFNLTWEKIIRDRDEQIWLENYLISRDSSNKNTSKYSLFGCLISFDVEFVNE